MNTQEQQILDTHVPEPVKHAVQYGQLHKIAAHRLGVEVLSLEKIAQHIGTKLAEKRQRYRPIAEGLLALHKLGR
jgi:hypothetical protein